MVNSFSKETFIYDFISAYGLPKATITKLKKGNTNLSKQSEEIASKNKLYFRMEDNADLHVTIDRMYSEYKYKE